MNFSCSEGMEGHLLGDEDLDRRLEEAYLGDLERDLERESSRRREVRVRSRLRDLDLDLE